MTSRTGTNRLPNDDDDAGGGSSGGGGGDDGDAEGESCGYVDANTVWRADLCSVPANRLRMRRP